MCDEPRVSDISPPCCANQWTFPEGKRFRSRPTQEFEAGNSTWGLVMGRDSEHGRRYGFEMFLRPFGNLAIIPMYMCHL